MKKTDKQEAQKRLFRVAEAAYYLGLSPRTIYNGIAPRSRDPFPVRHKKRGKVILFEKKDLDRYAESIPYADNQ
jgi:predicted DNA-binding transcriptional regulator AlpA